MRDLQVTIDPGGTTGFVVLCHPNGVITSEHYTVHTALEVMWSNRFWYHRFLIDHRDRIGAIVIEKFVLFPNPKTMQAQIGSEFPSVRTIGIIEAYAELLGLHDRITYQMPNDRNSAKIPQEHWKVVGPSDHVKDAYRHARYFAWMNRGKTL